LRVKNLILGIRSYGRAVRFIAFGPRQWPLASVPVVIAVAVFSVLAYTLVHVGFSMLADSKSSEWAQWLYRALVVVVALVFALALGATLAQPLSGPALEKLAQRYEIIHDHYSDYPRFSWLSNMARTLRVTLFALVFSSPVLAILALLTLLVPPLAIITVPLKVLVAALVFAWDLLDYPLGIRGHGVRARLSFMRTHFAAVLGLGLCSSLSLFVPGLGLLLLPVGVVAATDLVTRMEVPIPTTPVVGT
jgi:CysZ protein